MMRRPAIAGFLVLAGCGGGGSGGGTGSAGVVPVVPPPANVTITELVASQTFANDAASNTAAFDLTSRTTISASGAKSTLEVRYDAATKAYTLTNGGRTQTFGSADLQAATDAGVAQYRKDNGTSRDFLTLVTTPYSKTGSNQYVGLGYWQRNQSAAGRQDTTYDTFTYGLTTPATAVPRTGNAEYAIDVFGFYTMPGKTPKAIQGAGTFSADFLSGVFSANSSPIQFDLTSDSEVSGGGIKLVASGKLSGTDGSFSGIVGYESTGNTTVGGTVSGRLFGPAAEEVGASFGADGADGTALVGSFTGKKNGLIKENLALTNIVAGNQMIYSNGVEFTTGYTSSNAVSGGYGTLGRNGFVRPELDGSFTLNIGTSQNLTWTAADKVTSSQANFDAYRKTVAPRTIDLLLYKTGTANTQLALTYLSFGAWNENQLGNQRSQTFFVYGLETPSVLLSRRTGTAQYKGIAYGSAASTPLAARYVVTGTSEFNVDFSAAKLSGSMILAGRDEASGANRDFGNFTFGGDLLKTETRSFLAQNGIPLGTVNTRFYGPDAEEIGGTFQFALNPGVDGQQTGISGVTVARRVN